MRNFSNLTTGANLYAFFNINDEYASVPDGDDKMQIISHLAYLFETSLDTVLYEYKNLALQVSQDETMNFEDYIVERLNPSEARAVFNLVLFFKRVDQCMNDFYESGEFKLNSKVNRSLVFNYVNFNTGCSLVVSYIEY